MAEQVQLAEPKLVPLSAAEQAEAVGLLAALLRAAIATRTTGGRDPAVVGATCPATTAGKAGDCETAVHGRHPTRARSKAVKPVAGGLPLAPGANGKQGSRKSAGGKR